MHMDKNQKHLSKSTNLQHRTRRTTWIIERIQEIRDIRRTITHGATRASLENRANATYTPKYNELPHIEQLEQLEEIYQLQRST